MPSLADRLRERMQETGITQAEIARACGIRPPSVNAWLSGETKNLKGKNLVITARLLGVNDAWLADGIGPKERSATTWPFSAPYSAYEALDESQKKMLDGIVTAFIDNAVPAAKSTTKKEAA